MSGTIDQQTWKCGHLTPVIIASGTYTTINKVQNPNACPDCYSKHLLYRVAQIKALMTQVNTSFYAARNAEARFNVLRERERERGQQKTADIYNTDGKEFEAYSAEFVGFIGCVVEVEKRALGSDLSGYVAAINDFRTPFLNGLIGALEKLRDEAQSLANLGMRAENRCARQVEREVGEMIDEAKKEMAGRKDAIAGPPMMGDKLVDCVAALKSVEDDLAYLEQQAGKK
ncbi:hypothetical protein GGR50DRAFT_697215 [Xylaria sp. CBS 124048]|nr:hypothetical protein GGR50DRAFT_697215 [Xylaria sp. CBS 124048]